MSQSHCHIYPIEAYTQVTLAIVPDQHKVGIYLSFMTLQEAQKRLDESPLQKISVPQTHKDVLESEEILVPRPSSPHKDLNATSLP